MTRSYSLAYLTANESSVPEAISIAGKLGYASVGLRLKPNAPGAPFQSFIDDKQTQRETLARMADTGVTVFDIEIIRIGEVFDPKAYRPLLEAGAALQAKAVLVAADDTHAQRLAQHYAQLCEFMQPYGLTADLEFMPWTGVKDAKAALNIRRWLGIPKMLVSWLMRCTLADQPPHCLTFLASHRICYITRKCAMPKRA